MKTYWGCGDIAPRILKLGTNAGEWLALPLGKSHGYPLDKRLGGSQSRSGSGGEIKVPVPARNLTPVAQPVA